MRMNIDPENLAQSTLGIDTLVEMIRNNRPQPSGKVAHHYYLATSSGKNISGYFRKKENWSRFFIVDLEDILEYF